MSIRNLGLAALSVALAGCSAILNPQVHDTRFFNAQYGPKIGSDGQPGPATYAGDLAVAIDDANSQAKAYFDAAAQYSLMRNVTPLGAAALGISGLLLGATGGGSQNALIALGGASAAALGVEGFYDNRQRQFVYLGGATAISCAVAAQRPLLIPTAEWTAFAADTETLRSLLGRFERDLAAGRPRAPSPRYVLDTVMTVRDTAVATLRDAATFRRSVESAGLALRQKVTAIVAAVDTEVVKTDPDPQAMSKIISSVGTAASSVVKPAAASGAAADRNRLTGSSVDELDTDVDLLITQIGIVNSHLEAASVVADVDKATTACKLAEIPGALKIDPDETSHDVAGTGTTLVYSVRGGMLPISAGLSGEYPAGAFALTQTNTNGTIQLSVAIASTAAGKSATLTVSDASGAAPRKILIRVAAASGAGNAPNKSNPPPAPATVRPVATLTPQRVAMIRSTLEVKTGTGSPTLTSDDLAALKTFADSASVAFTDKPTTAAPLYKAIAAKARNAAQLLEVSEPEKALITGGLVTTLRQQCKLPSVAAGTSPFDALLRGKIFDFEDQDQRNVAADPAIDGRLDETRLKAMLQSCSKPG